VEVQNYLGIYISKDSATAVCVGPQGRSGEVVDAFTVRTDDPEQASPHVLASLISQGCTQRQWTYSEVAVALDCAMFMQHNIRSDFTDIKQIGATIRFDTEEALATDISDVALAFQIVSSDENGSELTVFTAKKDVLAEIIGSFQGSGMDPMSVEPDVTCLARFLGRDADRSEPGATLFGVLSARSGYLVLPRLGGTDTFAPRVRTFLLGSSKDRAAMLRREAVMTTALAGPEPVGRVKIFDSAGTVETESLGEQLGLSAVELDITAPGLVGEKAADETAEPVELAIAYGAVLGYYDKAQLTNFRDDFMPYQGKKVRLRKALRFFSVSVWVLLVATGLYFQTQMFSVNKYRAKVRKKFAADYAVVMNQPLRKTTKIKDAVRALQKIKARLENSNSDIPADDVSRKLGMVFDAFNRSSAQTKLDIDNVSISEKNISITGQTAGRSYTLKFFAIVESAGLKIVQQRLDTEPGADKFTIRVEPARK